MDPALVAMLGGIDSPLTKTALHWLAKNKDAEVLLDRVVKLGHGGRSAAAQVISWIASRQSDIEDTPDIAPQLTPVPLEKAAEVIETLDIAGRLSATKPGQMIERKGRKNRILPSDRRIGLGLTKVDGLLQPAMVVEKLTNNLQRAIDGATTSPTCIAVGQMIAGPSADARRDAILGHLPGRSVAHCAGQAGSLGAYVTFYDRQDRELVGLLGSSHVLSNLGTANIGDKIYSPGYPDEARDDIFSYAELRNYRRLCHHNSATLANIPVNSVDVAVAALHDTTLPIRNLIRDPVSATLGQVKHVASLTDIQENLLSEVYIAGRTTAFQKGRLTVTDIAQYPIKMPDQKNYMFEGLALVESMSVEAPFSRPGDSGAMVYKPVNGKLFALGFIVGGSESHSLFVPALTCLNAMKATLHV